VDGVAKPRPLSIGVQTFRFGYGKISTAKSEGLDSIMIRAKSEGLDSIIIRAKSEGLDSIMIRAKSEGLDSIISNFPRSQTLFGNACPDALRRIWH